MPAITPLHLNHLTPRFGTSGVSSGISATAIGLLIGVGLIPALILIWVVCWLLFAYPGDRNICCCVRKRKTDPVPPMVLRSSQETLWEEAVVSMPKKPYAAWARTDSGSSRGTEGHERLKKERAEWRERLSGLSEGSGETVVEGQDVRRFV